MAIPIMVPTETNLGIGSDSVSVNTAIWNQNFQNQKQEIPVPTSQEREEGENWELGGELTRTASKMVLGGGLNGERERVRKREIRQDGSRGEKKE